MDRQDCWNHTRFILAMVLDHRRKMQQVKITLLLSSKSSEVRIYTDDKGQTVYTKKNYLHIKKTHIIKNDQSMALYHRWRHIAVNIYFIIDWSPACTPTVVRLRSTSCRQSAARTLHTPPG